MFELLLHGKNERKNQLVSVAEIDMQNELLIFDEFVSNVNNTNKSKLNMTIQESMM